MILVYYFIVQQLFVLLFTLILDIRCRIILVLNWHRDYNKYKTLSSIFQISKSVISREIRFLLPKISLSLNEINYPEQWIPHSFENVVGAIDCTGLVIEDQIYIAKAGTRSRRVFVLLLKQYLV